MTPDLYKNLVVLDRVQHRALRLKHPFTDLTPTGGMNSIFAAAVEFADLCREYPIVFVRAGKDEASGEELFAPVAMLGLQTGENLYLLPHGRWRTHYVPAFLRRYPFAMVQMGPDQLAIGIDRSFEGFSETEGDPLFGPDGQPTELMVNAQNFVQGYEEEVHRTKAFCALLNREGLLQDMRFDATLPDGQKVGVDGFMMIDEKKLADLPEAKVVELHRNGVLSLIHAQQVSMGLMRKLVEWHVERKAAKQ